MTKMSNVNVKCAVQWFVEQFKKQNINIVSEDYEGNTHVTELLYNRVHLEFGRVTVVDTGPPRFLIAGLVHFLQKEWSEKKWWAENNGKQK